MPGFMDTLGYYRTISNIFFLNLIFSTIRNVKFVLVARYSDIQRMALLFFLMIRSFFNIFNNYPDKIKEISKYVSLVLTAVPQNIDESHLIDSIIRLPRMPSTSDRACFDILKEELLKNKRVFKLQTAELGKVIDRDHDLKNRINKSMPSWWCREISNGFVSTKDLKITVLGGLYWDE